MPDPRSGIAETPFDNIDLGSQLLQAVASAHENTLREHRLKLDEKELGIREKQMQMSAAASVLPYLAAGGPKAGAVEIAGGLAPGSVSPDQLFTPAKEQIDQSFVDRMKSDPAFAKSYQDVGAFGPEMGQLDEGNRRMAAEIATKLRTSPGERAAYGLEMMKMFGDKAATLFNRYASDTGVTAPVGVPTIGQREAGAAETSARAHAGAAQADLERVRIDLANTLGPGFTTKDPNLDPALKQKYVGEWVDFMARKRSAISPEALDAVIPIGAVGRGIRAAAELSAAYKAQLAKVRMMSSRAMSDKATPADKETFKQEMEKLDQLAPGYVSPTPAAGEPQLLQGERLTRHIQEWSSLIPGSESWFASQLREQAPVAGAFQESKSSFERVIGPADQKGPTPQTLGALSDPKLAHDFKGQAWTVDQSKRIVRAYREAGASPAEAAALEVDFVRHLRNADFNEMKDLIDGSLRTIVQLRELNKVQ